MKKLLMVLLCLLIAGGIVAGVGYWYVSADASPQMPATAPSIGGVYLQPTEAEWHRPMLGGLFYKHQYESYPVTEMMPLLSWPVQEMAITLPDRDHSYTATLSYNGAQVYSGEPEGLADISLYAEPGYYEVSIRCEKARQQSQAYGHILYWTALSLEGEPEPPEPEPDPRPEGLSITTGAEVLQQGDVFSLKLWNVPEGTAPSVSSDLGLAVCTPLENGDWYCAVPVGNTRNPGSYPVNVTVGEVQWSTSVTVEEFAFEEQNLIIDVTDPVISEANSAAAYQQYREKIPPLFSTYDEDIYWAGTFIQPAQGRISTHFGTIRYTNSDFSSPSYHWGMDIAADEGTPVLAPAGGRVVLAEYLLNTGNTICIEHGGGLKSYYFHMSELKVAEGDYVQQGDDIGAIGTTGYSTGPHLHFEVRIGNQAISPEMLFEDSAGLYDAAAAGAEGARPLE